MASVRLEGLRKYFGTVEVVQHVDLDVADGEMLVLVGPSGCGKSTLLRLIAGLEEASAGSIFIGDTEVTATPAAARELSMVFQSYALYPHKTVAENMAFALRMAKFPAAEIDAKVTQAAEILNLSGLLERKPAQLSGGQRQRVAIGRAIVREPKVFLFDEPLSNLDAALRSQTRVEIARLHHRLAATMIYVTHDQVEAMTLADRIAVLSIGKMEQLGAPLELYKNPANLFVASFLGSPQMNILPGQPLAQERGAIQLADGNILRTARKLTDGAAVNLGCRPEHIRLENNDGGDNLICGTIVLVERLGADTFLHVNIADDTIITVRHEAEVKADIGDNITLRLPPAQLHLFAEDGRTLTRNV